MIALAYITNYLFTNTLPHQAEFLDPVTFVLLVSELSSVSLLQE